MKTLFIICTQHPTDVVIRGICEDVTLFKDAHFASVDEMIQYLDRHYPDHTTSYIAHIPKEMRP